MRLFIKSNNNKNISNLEINVRHGKNSTDLWSLGSR